MKHILDIPHLMFIFTACFQSSDGAFLKILLPNSPPEGHDLHLLRVCEGAGVTTFKRCCQAFEGVIRQGLSCLPLEEARHVLCVCCVYRALNAI